MIDTAGTTPSARPTAGGGRGGIAGPTAVVLVAVVTLAAAMISAITGNGFGAFFNAVYLIVTVYAALRVHVADRAVTVVAPPIIYALSVFVAGFFDSEEVSHAFRRVLENTFVNVSFGAPWLVTATMATIVIALVRGRRDKVASHRR